MRLTSSTEYDVRVRGENAVGRSVPSVTMRAKTDSELIETISFQGPTRIAKLFKLQEKLLCSDMIVVNKASLFLT